MSGEACWTCRFFVNEDSGGPQPASSGECHRYPPQRACNDLGCADEFPNVGGRQWCGEHREAAPSRRASSR